METQLQNQFNKLENQRFQLIEFVKSISHLEQNRIPSQGKWSVNQILLHLILAEELSVKSIKAKIITSQNIEKTGWMNSIRVLLLRIFLRSSKKFKAPKAVSDLPQHLEFKELAERWNVARKNLNDLLESLPETLLNKSIFKHPVAGKLTIYGGLSFIEEHVRRHQKQIHQLSNPNEKL